MLEKKKRRHLVSNQAVKVLFRRSVRQGSGQIFHKWHWWKDERIRNKMLFQIPNGNQHGTVQVEFETMFLSVLCISCIDKVCTTKTFDQHMKLHNQAADLHYGTAFLDTQNTQAIYRQLWVKHTVSNEAEMSGHVSFIALPKWQISAPRHPNLRCPTHPPTHK